MNNDLDEWADRQLRKVTAITVSVVCGFAAYLSGVLLMADTTAGWEVFWGM